MLLLECVSIVDSLFCRRKALAEAKVSGGGRSICSFRCCILFVVSAVLCGVILVMAWMLMNIEKDIEDLKGRIRKGKFAR